MNKILLESTMEDSFIYKSFNASNALIDRIVKYLKTSAALDKSYFYESYMYMKRNTISPLSKRVMDAYDTGMIELLYSRETKIGLSVPFIVRKNETGKVVVTIFIASFATIGKDDNLNIPVKQLYALMESAYVALQLQVNPTKIQRNVGIMKICSDVYLEMVMRILNKEYALTLDLTLYDQVSYCIRKFFLTNVWEYINPELIESYTTNSLENITDLDLDMLKTTYRDANIKDIDDLMKLLATLSPRMKGLNTRYFIERFVNSYHGSSILCIDYLPYVFFVIINILLGSFLISQASLNDVIKNVKGINKFYPELAKLI